jgi:colicin import membrane protein
MMTPARRKMNGTLAFALVLAIVPLQQAFAQAEQAGAPVTPPTMAQTVAGHFPAGSINNVDMADKALDEVTAARTDIDTRFKAEERACYARFFVNSCIDGAKERQRTASAQMHRVEIEANTFKRKTRVDERDRVLAEKNAQEAEQAPQREQQREEKEQTQTKKAAELAEKAKQAESAPRPAKAIDRNAAHEAKLKRLQATESADAKKRADNIAAYEKKVQQAHAHQHEVDAKKLEKTQKEKPETATRPASAP